jgi:single-strand selective monofunctional uracil DNA glycosylase
MVMGSPLVGIARELGEAVDELGFAAPVSHVYNPLDYAWPAHAQYLETLRRRAPGGAPRSA